MKTFTASVLTLLLSLTAQSARTQSLTAETFSDAAPIASADEFVMCWGGEPCESAIEPGVYYVHTNRANGRTTGPQRWPLLDVGVDIVDDGVNCGSKTETPCFDEATGFQYGYWRGSWHWFSEEAEISGLQGHGWQHWNQNPNISPLSQ